MKLKSLQRRPRSTAAFAAVVLLSGIVLTDHGTSGAATPPAELVSVITETGESHTPSINQDGGLVAFNFDDFIFEGSVALGKVRNRNVPQTDAVPMLPGLTNDQYDLVISRDGCQLVHFSHVLIDPSIPGIPPISVPILVSVPAVVVVNRCTGSAPLQLYTADIGQSDGGFGNLAISAHGRYVAFTDFSGTTGPHVILLDRDVDGNGVLDDSALGTVETTFPANGASLGDENLTNKVALAATAPGSKALLAYLWDPTNPVALTLVSANDAATTPIAGVSAFAPSMTPDGRYVAFVTSKPSTAVIAVFPPSDQVLVRDVLTNHTAVVSRNAAGAPSNGRSEMPSISADGTQIAFGTTSTDLLAPGVGGLYNPAGFVSSLDLLVARSTSGLYATLAFDRVSLKPNGDAIDPKQPTDPTNPNFQSMDMEQPVISSNGRWVAFASRFNAELQTGGSSLTPPVDTKRNVYVIGRPTALTVTPLDFGTLQVGTNSGVLLATVTNTGISSVLPASIAATGNFTVVAGGTCAVNTWISPGGSCTVGVRFNPSAAGTRSGTLTIAESGFAAVSGAGALTGIGQVAVVIGTTTTTVKATTTTIPKVPKIGVLAVDPDPGSFGNVVVGTVSAEMAFVVTSSGTRSVPITNVILEGTNQTQFVITSTDCPGANIPPGGTCGISATFNPTSAGPLTAVLTVVTPLGTATSDLDGIGIFQPTLRLLPNVVAVGEVTIAAGAGFPAGQPVQVHWLTDTVLFTGTADAAGNLTIQIPIRPDESTGPRTLTAVDQPGLYTGVTTPGLVVDTSMQPPTGQNPALPNFPALIVRG
jgi:Tol biopolymer transport system component